MKCAVTFLLAVAGAVALQQEPGAAANTAGSLAGGAPSTEQRTVDRQNEALSLAFAQAFPADTAEEFRPLVVELFVRCQAALDSCAELLWETHLLRAYRNCALTQRRFCAQDIQELQAQLAAIVEAG